MEKETAELLRVVSVSASEVRWKHRILPSHNVAVSCPWQVDGMQAAANLAL